MAGLRSTTIGVISLCMSTCGCGLIHIPYLQTLPNEPVRYIVVSDLETGQPLEDATVSFRMQRWENFMEPMPFWGTGDVERTMANRDADRPIIEWNARPLGSGSFVFDTRTELATVQVWFPLGIPLGFFSHHCYDGSVVVSAPGHETIWVGNSLTEAHVDHFFADRDRPDEPCLKFQEDHLCVRLPQASTDTGGTPQPTCTRPAPGSPVICNERRPRPTVANRVLPGNPTFLKN